MPEHVVRFDVKRSDTMDLPGELLREGHYSISVDSDRSITIEGTSNGLLFLAEVLVRAAVGGYDRGFHVHLPLDSSDDRPNLDAGPELTIYAAENIRRA